jgi:hypothetical protein
MLGVLVTWEVNERAKVGWKRPSFDDDVMGAAPVTERVARTNSAKRLEQEYSGTVVEYTVQLYKCMHVVRRFFV